MPSGGGARSSALLPQPRFAGHDRCDRHQAGHVFATLRRLGGERGTEADANEHDPRDTAHGSGGRDRLTHAPDPLRPTVCVQVSPGRVTRAVEVETQGRESRRGRSPRKTAQRPVCALRLVTERGADHDRRVAQRRSRCGRVMPTEERTLRGSEVEWNGARELAHLIASVADANELSA